MGFEVVGIVVAIVLVGVCLFQWWKMRSVYHYNNLPQELALHHQRKNKLRA